MRLVYGEQGQPGCFLHLFEQRQKAGHQQALRSDVEQVELAAQQAALHLARSLALRLELRKAAFTPSWMSASTWSCISAISGDTTMPTPCRSSAGIW